MELVIGWAAIPYFFFGSLVWLGVMLFMIAQQWKGR